MSYSFSVKAPNKAAAKDAVAQKFDEIIGQQPIHAKDRAAVMANASAVIDLVSDDESKDVSVSCNGYVSWTSGSNESDKFIGASVACSASLANRE